MAVLKQDIKWGEPNLPQFHIPEWEDEVKADLGFVPDALTRVSRSPWIRRICLRWSRLPVKLYSSRLADIAMLVIAQENACKYCYGHARSVLKLYGYSEKLIGKIERDMHISEFDEKERTFMQFCRNLSRSNPRPPKRDRDKLIELGFAPKTVSEMAFHIANHCMLNRINTFVASPLENYYEDLEKSFMGRYLRPLVARKMRMEGLKNVHPLPKGDTDYPLIVRVLEDLPAATILHEAMEGAFSSKVLSTELKSLILAVIARTLDCSYCQSVALRMTKDIELSERDFLNAVSLLKSPRLNEQESNILEWSRLTIHYEASEIQKETRKLAYKVDEDVLLEAIGWTSLANSMVRLAVLV